jgi:hypothetical protein
MAADFQAAHVAPFSEKAKALLFEHSELFKELKEGDPDATPEGCLTFQACMPPEDLNDALALLSDICSQCPRVFEDSLYIFDLHPRIPSPQNFTALSPARVDALKQLADYLRLPKVLLALVDELRAVTAAMAEYKAETSFFDSITSSFDGATKPRPRLLNFLLKDPITRARLEAAFRIVERAAGYYEENEPRLPYDLLMFGTSSRYLAIRDGIFGEPLHQIGLKADSNRLIRYAGGCLIAGRELPVEFKPEFAEDVFFWAFFPLVGGFGRLSEAQRCLPFAGERSWIVCMRTAASGGHFALLQWCYTNCPWCINGMHLARWLMEA